MKIKGSSTGLPPIQVSRRKLKAKIIFVIYFRFSFVLVWVVGDSGRI